jgi:hypothetical protein
MSRPASFSSTRAMPSSPVFKKGVGIEARIGAVDEGPDEIDNRIGEPAKRVFQFESFLGNEKQPVDHEKDWHHIMQDHVGHQIPACEIGEMAQDKIVR